MARIKLLQEKSDIGEDQYAEFDSIKNAQDRVSSPHAAYMHSPGLGGTVMELGHALRLRSTITQAERELAIIAVAREFDDVCSWSHVNMARRDGVPESTIETVRDRGDLKGLDEDERDIVAAVRALIRDHRVDEELYGRLQARHGDRWMVEFAGVIGLYLYHAATNNLFEIEPGPNVERLPV